jgi:Protein of unknown function (DUF3558)
MVIRIPLLAAALIGLAFTSACTTTSKGDPLPASSTGTTPSGSGNEKLPYAGAPTVKNPLDSSEYERDPCKSLSPEQAQSLNLPATGKTDEDEPLGVGCTWRNEATRGEADIVFLVDDRRGLSPEYESRNQGELPNFEELPAVEGYPAITRKGADKYGGCTVVVGVADDMAFEVSVALSQANIGKREPCEVASQVAGLAVQTMKRGA